MVLISKMSASQHVTTSPEYSQANSSEIHFWREKVPQGRMKHLKEAKSLDKNSTSPKTTKTEILIHDLKKTPTALF